MQPRFAVLFVAGVEHLLNALHHGEHLLINSFEFTSSIINWKKYVQSIIYVIGINTKVSKVSLIAENWSN